MIRFKCYYKASAAILSFLLVLSGLRGLLAGEILLAVVVLLIAAVPYVPMLRSGGLEQNRRLAICISLLLAAGFAAFQALFYIEFVRTGGLEGPNGEGSPGAVIIAMVLFAVIFLFPWLLTALRGLRVWNLNIRQADR